MEGVAEPGLPPGWRETHVAGSKLWAKEDGTTASVGYYPFNGERRHVVIVRGNRTRPPYDEVAELGVVLARGAPLAPVSAAFLPGQLTTTVVLVETSDHILSRIWAATAHRFEGENGKIEWTGVLEDAG